MQNNNCLNYSTRQTALFCITCYVECVFIICRQFASKCNKASFNSELDMLLKIKYGTNISYYSSAYIMLSLIILQHNECCVRA